MNTKEIQQRIRDAERELKEAKEELQKANKEPTPKAGEVWSYDNVPQNHWLFCTKGQVCIAGIAAGNYSSSSPAEKPKSYTRLGTFEEVYPVTAEQLKRDYVKKEELFDLALEMDRNHLPKQELLKAILHCSRADLSAQETRRHIMSLV